MKNSLTRRIDWLQTLIPLVSVAGLVMVFLWFPQQSTRFLQQLRGRLEIILAGSTSYWGSESL